MIFKHGCDISALEYIRMLILRSYVLLACINTIYKYDLMRCILSINFWAQ